MSNQHEVDKVNRDSEDERLPFARTNTIDHYQGLQNMNLSGHEYQSLEPDTKPIDEQKVNLSGYEYHAWNQTQNQLMALLTLAGKLKTWFSEVRHLDTS